MAITGLQKYVSIMYGKFQHVYQNLFRETDAGENRITDDGNQRITDASDY